MIPRLQQLKDYSLLTTIITTILITTITTILIFPPPTTPHALPPPPALPTNPTLSSFPSITNQNSTPPNWDLTCTPKRSLFTPCPSYHDCLRAIFKLPDLRGSGAFHNGAPDDVFRLPVQKSYASCRVRVELVHEGSGRQSASWHAIIARAVALDSICIDTPMWERRNSGGWTALGSQQRLAVILEYNGDGVGGGNVTVL